MRKDKIVEALLRTSGAVKDSPDLVDEDIIFSRPSNLKALASHVHGLFRGKEKILRSDGVNLVLGVNCAGASLANYVADFFLVSSQMNIAPAYVLKSQDDISIKETSAKIIKGKKAILLVYSLSNASDVKTLLDSFEKHECKIAHLVAISGKGGITSKDIGVPNYSSLWSW